MFCLYLISLISRLYFSCLLQCIKKLLEWPHQKRILGLLFGLRPNTLAALIVIALAYLKVHPVLVTNFKRSVVSYIFNYLWWLACSQGSILIIFHEIDDLCHLHSTVQFANISYSLVNFELLQILGDHFQATTSKKSSNG